MSVVSPYDVAAAVRAANDIREADAAQDIRDEYRMARLAQLWSETLVDGAVDFPPEVMEFVRARVDRLVAADTVVRLAGFALDRDELPPSHGGVPAGMMQTFEDLVARGNAVASYRVWIASVPYQSPLRPGMTAWELPLYGLTLLTGWRIAGVRGTELVGRVRVEHAGTGQLVSEVSLERATRSVPVPAVLLLAARSTLTMHTDVDYEAVLDGEVRPKIELEGWVATPR